jgi:hypothetical protein
MNKRQGFGSAFRFAKKKIKKYKKSVKKVLTNSRLSVIIYYREGKINPLKKKTISPKGQEVKI